MTRLAWIAAASLAMLGVYMALLFLAQRSMLFPIPRHVPDDPGDRAEVVRAASADGNGYGLLLAARREGAAPLVLFMHGNGELADYWVDEFEVLRDAGIGVLLVEYPGYGRAEGSPSESSINQSAKALYDWAVADPRVDAARIVAYGRSLGGGAAARLAIERRVAALILESAFTSVADFAARFFAPSFLIRDPFDNRKALASYRGPLLVIHGRRDTIVPVAHGRELAALVPGARLVELDCGHNDCPRDWRSIAAFLAEHGVANRGRSQD